MDPQKYFYEICVNREDTLQCIDKFENSLNHSYIFGIVTTLVLFSILLAVGILTAAFTSANN